MKHIPKILLFLVMAFVGVQLTLPDPVIYKRVEKLDERVSNIQRSYFSTVNTLIERMEVADRNRDHLQDEFYASLPQGKDGPMLGASLAIPSVVALFETTLASGITSSATTFTLTSATYNSGGSTLASSTYAFIIDEGTASQELVLADCTATACTNAVRGLDRLTGTTTVSALQFSHRRGSSVKITDGPQLMILSRILNGIATVPNLLTYASGTACSAGSSASALCDKAYMDALSVQGAATSTESVTGIVRLATQLQMASSTDSGANTPLVVQAKYSTSTPGYAGLWNVISKNNGKLAQAWYDLTEAFSWSGNHTFTGSTTTINNLVVATSTSAQTFNLIPPGTVMAYATTTAPDGWLLADGTSYLRTAYPKLFNVIGTSYGAADGTHFNVPNIQDRSIKMASTTVNMAQTGGEANHTMAAAELVGHTHTLAGQSGGTIGAGSYPVSGTSNTTTYTTNSTGSATPFNVLDPYLVMMYIIKY